MPIPPFRRFDFRFTAAPTITKRNTQGGSVMRECKDARKFIEKLTRGAVKKSVMASIVVALFSLAIFAGIGWYFGFLSVWVYVPVFFAIIAVFTPIFYFAKYRKSERAVASVIDELGLEERMITMESLKDDDSYIARRQREDTLGALAKVSEKRLSLVLSTALLVCLAVALPLGAGLTTVSALSANGVLPFGRDVAKGIPAKYSLIYTATDGGTLSGKTEQRVTEGEAGSFVVAVPGAGYVFVKWSDGVKDNARSDVPTDGDITVKAVFEALADYDPDEAFRKPGEGQSDSDSEKKNDDAPSDSGGEPQPGDPSKDGDDNGGGTGGGAADESQLIIDGKTYYGDKIYDDAHQNAIDRVNNDSKLTSGDKNLIDDYFNSIGRG